MPCWFIQGLANIITALINMCFQFVVEVVLPQWLQNLIANEFTPLSPPNLCSC
jgi:hypothetical protein